MLEKLKLFLADDALFQAVLLILVAITSFGLGRQSILEGEGESVDMAPISISEPVSAASPLAPMPLVASSSLEEGVFQTAVIDGVVASKSGSKYHLPTCPGAKAIKPENLVSFNSRAEAEAAGYTPAANCKFN